MIPLNTGKPGTLAALQEPGWQELLFGAISALMLHPKVLANISADHTLETPSRVVRAFEEYFSGLMEDPAEVLRKGFERGKYNQMITLAGIKCVSFCAHHLTPILCNVHFSYLPATDTGAVIVGLSKIPRLIEIYARRPQFQEKMSQEIVECFQSVVQPLGCGVVIDAVHLCVAIRGVRKDGVVTRTTALTGQFLNNASTRDEFLAAVPSMESFSWT